MVEGVEFHGGYEPGKFVLAIGGEALLTISPDGTVDAPSLEAASEAGRVFVDSIRQYLKASR